MANKKITNKDVEHLAKLANLPISLDRQEILSSQLEATFEYVDTLQKTDTSKVTETNQVTGLKNIFREDVVDSTRQFSQKQALANASRTHKGYFVVPGVLE